MIKQIKTSQEFEELTEDFRTLDVWTFGPLVDLDDNEDGEIQVLTIEENGETVAYLIAEGSDLWHIESKYQGRGYAKQLIEAAGIEFVYEVCSDEGVALCEALNLEYEDCR